MACHSRSQLAPTIFITIILLIFPAKKFASAWPHGYPPPPPATCISYQPPPAQPVTKQPPPLPCLPPSPPMPPQTIAPPAPPTQNIVPPPSQFTQPVVNFAGPPPPPNPVLPYFPFMYRFPPPLPHSSATSLALLNLRLPSLIVSVIFGLLLLA